eukprot:365791-Chlamydomonas_euryale.AAC.1
MRSMRSSLRPPMRSLRASLRPLMRSVRSSLRPLTCSCIAPGVCVRASCVGENLKPNLRPNPPPHIFAEGKVQPPPALLHAPTLPRRYATKCLALGICCRLEHDGMFAEGGMLPLLHAPTLPRRCATKCLALGICCRLEHDGMFAEGGIQPVNFWTVATPHLGSVRTQPRCDCFKTAFPARTVCSIFTRITRRRAVRFVWERLWLQTCLPVPPFEGARPVAFSFVCSHVYRNMLPITSVRDGSAAAFQPPFQSLHPTACSATTRTGLATSLLLGAPPVAACTTACTTAWCQSCRPTLATSLY